MGIVAFLSFPKVDHFGNDAKIVLEQNKSSKNSPGLRGFHKYTTLAIMPILASDALLRENKK